MILNKKVFALLVMIYIVVMGCGSSTIYSRKSADPKEIYWSYNDGLEANQDGKRVASEANSWENLPDVVQCVKRAVPYAKEANSNTSTGKVLKYVGLAVSLLSVAAGTGMTIYGITDEDVGMVLGGLGVMVGGSLIIGLPMSSSGADDIAEGTTQAVDAVNIYNDYSSQCKESTPKSPE